MYSTEAYYAGATEYLQTKNRYLNHANLLNGKYFFFYYFMFKEN